jgi:hypothetical protein
LHYVVSPILFNQIVEVPQDLLNYTKDSGHLRRLIPNSIPHGISQLQYGDDTMLLIEHDEKSVRTMKFMFYCF